MNTTITRLTLTEREEISKGIWAEETFSSIAKRIGFDVSTISREVWRNVKRKKRSYSAVKSEEKAKSLNKNKGRKEKLLTNNKLRNYVYEKLIKKWSPEQIANSIKNDYTDDNTMRISHETIYHHIYCLPKGELKKELIKGLRQERRWRLKRKNTHYRKQRIKDIISISERPKEAEGRIIPGHWEGDLIIGKNHNSAIGTLVERTTRLTLIVPLKEKNAFAVRSAFAKAFEKIPKKFKKTLTYDRGLEMSEHKLFTEETKISVYFADPHAPWQRGTNENTNGLIRQYFPKGTDFSKVSALDIKKVELELNERPRKVLNFNTPIKMFYQLIAGKNFAIET